MVLNCTEVKPTTTLTNRTEGIQSSKEPAMYAARPRKSLLDRRSSYFRVRPGVLDSTCAGGKSLVKCNDVNNTYRVVLHCVSQR